MRFHKYRQCDHLFALILAMFVHIAFTAFIFFDGIQNDSLLAKHYFISGVIIFFTLFWIAKRLKLLSLHAHYNVLIFELLSFLFILMFLVFFDTFENKPLGVLFKLPDWLVFLLFLDLLLSLLLLMYWLALVPCVLLVGNEEQKKELARELNGNDVEPEPENP